MIRPDELKAAIERAKAWVDGRNYSLPAKDVIALIDAARQAEAWREVAVSLQVQLSNLLSVYSEPDRQMCCDGRMCGCMGATVYQEAEHYARTALAEAESALPAPEPKGT